MTKEKTLLLFVIALFAGFFAQGQTVTIVGSGTESTAFPPNTKYWDYSWCSMLYNQEEVGGAKTITSLAFDQKADYTGYWEYAIISNQKIYMKEVMGSNLNTAMYPDPTNNGYTLVYDGTSNPIQFELGWSDIQLDQNFEYSGSGSIVVLWENRKGNEPPMVGLLFNGSMLSTTDQVVHGGSDEGFPTSEGEYDNIRPNIAFTSEIQDDTPATPGLTFPNNLAIKTNIDVELGFHIGVNTTSYDVYVGTSETFAEPVFTNSSAISENDYVFNVYEIASDFLLPNTQYFWKIVSKNDAESVSSEVRSFTTQAIIEDFYTTSFEDSLIMNPTAAQCDWTWPVSGTSNWRASYLDAHFGNYSVDCNVWFNTGDYSLQTPRMLIRNESRIKYWYRGGDAVNDKIKDGLEYNLYVELTEDLGETWTTIHSHEIANNMLEWDQVIVNLTGVRSDSAYIRFRYVSNSIYNADHFFLDDFTFEEISENAYCQIDLENINFQNLVANGQTYVDVPVSNTGSADLSFTSINVSAPFSCEYDGVIPSGEKDTLRVFFSPLLPGNYNANLQLEGDFDGDELLPIEGVATAQEDEFYQNFDSSLEFPDGWTQIRTLDPYDQFTTVSVKIGGDYAFSAPNSVKMQKLNDTISPLVFVSEGVRNFDDNVFKFMLKAGHPSYDLNLIVGVMSDPYHFESFEAIQTIQVPTDFQQFSITFEGEVGPYIAFYMPICDKYNSLYLDDISWESSANTVPGCPILASPLDNQNDVDIMMDTKLVWSASSGNTEGYYISLGTNEDADNIIDQQDVGIITSGSVAQFMLYNTTYYWKVAAYNEFGTSESCQIYSFTTMSDPTVSVYPYTQNFDNVLSTNGFDVPLGWSFDNANEDAITWDLLSNQVEGSLAHSAPYSMHMLYRLNSMDDYLFTCPFEMSADKEYHISFWNRTVGDQYVTNPIESLNVIIASDNSASSSLSIIYENQNLENQVWKNDNGVYQPDEDGVYYFAFHAMSEPNQGLLLVDDVTITEHELQSVHTALDDELCVYPNPVGSELMINNSENSTLTIMSIDGKIVFNMKNAEANTRIDVSSYPTGLYLVNIEQNNRVITKKISVVR